MKTNRQQFIDFINDNEQRDLYLTYENNANDRLIKHTFGRLDYIYIFTSFKSKKGAIPNDDENAEFFGIKDLTTQKLYFIKWWKLYQEFNTEEEIKNIWEITSESELDKKIQDDIIKELDELGKFVGNDIPLMPGDFLDATRIARQEYFYDKPHGKKRWMGRDVVKFEDLLAYIENPQKAIQNLLDRLESGEEEYLKPSYMAKYFLKYEETITKELSKIKSDPEYAPLRQKKTIKESIPKEAKTVNLLYLLDNGEVLEGDIESYELTDLSFWNDDCNILECKLTPETRARYEKTNGQDRLTYPNIIEITYKGKIIYKNPEHEEKLKEKEREVM